MHSSRLKRKLVDLGVDVSSRKASQNFCLIGTPLPPLEKSKDINEFVPLWKQDVRDEKGRRRLHGAFTGGFSAGYFNTVGSKEGWTPSTFISSKGDRAKKKASRPQDFMDEEDLQEMREGMNFVDKTEAMDLTGGAEAELARRAAEEYDSDPVRSALVMALIPSPKESAGAKLLKKMGWKPGQGIGSRISYRLRKLQDKQAATNKPLTLADIVITEEEEEASKHKYPRRDVPIPSYEKRDDFRGLGYASGLSLNESLGRSKPEADNGPSISTGFGLGALNDADEDDIDVYDGSHRTSRSKIAYDITDHENDTVVSTLKKPKTESRRITANTTFSDGLPLLPGFVLADKSETADKWFPSPEVPPGWKPDPKRVWDSDPNKDNVRTQETESGPLPHHKWKTGMTAEERGELLGETPLATAPRSVFEYISKKDRERIQNIAASLIGPQPAAPPELRIPHMEPHIAQAALSGFQPFISDTAKHARYTAYLLSQADPNSATPETLKPLPGQRTDEFNKELEDYAKAAAIFKPMTGAMAGRFTSAAIVEQGPQVREGLHTPSAEEVEKHEAEEKKRQEEKLTPQQNAAKLGMYGPMTREVRTWQPARLLCKRFGVTEPEVRPESDFGTQSTAAPEMAPAPSWQEQAGVSIPVPDVETASTIPKRDFSNIGLGEDETQGVDTLTYQRPAMDIFKAIFASDENESEDEDVKDEEAEEAEEAEDHKAEDVTAKFFPESKEVKEEGPIDLGSFKPTFIPRDRKSKGKDKDKDKDNGKTKGTDGKEKKRDKEKKKRDKVLVSFEVEEDGAGLTVSSQTGKDKDRDKNRPKKKRKAKERQEDGTEDAMWESKGPTEDVSKASEQASTDTAPVHKGRKRAIDFM
ncbi:hypothetical protein APHAL10511_003950 [Amanita phalloides]|nr:hypothetical protein APHAL10511_003950 [Amanita phalloides]